jgi:hypothetical protein
VAPGPVVWSFALAVLGALAACSSPQSSGGTGCARAAQDAPGTRRVREASDAGTVDRGNAREVADSVANEELRRLEAKHRPERPGLALSLIDFDVQPAEPSAMGGCVSYGFFYSYRQPTGRELGPGESHFNVFVAEDGMAWILFGK